MPLLLGKMAARPISGKLERERGSAVCFRHISPEAPSKRNKSLDKSSQRPGRQQRRGCVFSVLDGPGRWQISVRAKRGPRSTICPRWGSRRRLRPHRSQPARQSHRAPPARLKPSSRNTWVDCVGRLQAVWRHIFEVVLFMHH